MAYKKTSLNHKHNFSFSWKDYVCLFAILLFTLGVLIIVSLTPIGQQPEDWFLQSWLRLWNVFSF